MRIIYEQASGIVGVLVPAPKFLAELSGTDEEKLIHIANKDLPTGTKYEIIDETVTDISDRSFRNAWEYETGSAEKTSSDLTAEELEKYEMTENL
tara:strand:+ start:526 stop:810 length:285 start_codon:yes stop_codon:yes gene_type:complete